MEDNKNTFTQGPSLTLEPGLDPEPPKGAPLMEAKPEMDPVQKEMAETVLTEEEQKMVDAFAEIPIRSSSTAPEPRKKWQIFPTKPWKM